MNEDYRMSLLQERHDRDVYCAHCASDEHVTEKHEDDPEVDEDDFDYAEFMVWVERHRAWVAERSL